MSHKICRHSDDWLLRVTVQVSCDAYRHVVRGDPRFIEFFQTATPVNELGRMNIGSRPAKRKAAGSIDQLRAIPWIFAWTQTRFHLPVWLGIGDAFQVTIKCWTLEKKGILLSAYFWWGMRPYQSAITAAVLAKRDSCSGYNIVRCKQYGWTSSGNLYLSGIGLTVKILSIIW